MILATYYTSKVINPEEFRESDLYGPDSQYNAQVCFNGPRDGDYRVSMKDYWGVIYFHRNGQMDIEIANLNEELLLDILQELASTFFVKLTLHQPLGIPGIPEIVKPQPVKEM